MSEEKKVIIIGAGFAGLFAVKEFFNKKNVSVMIIDKNNYHTFLPLLYQVGAAEIEPEQIAYPIRSLLRGKKNTSYIRGLVSSINYKEKYLICNGQIFNFDYLIVATGTVTNFFNTPGSEQYSFSLKNLDEAIIVRNHILSCFERAVYTIDREYRKKLLSFIIVGGGPTGIEFSGALTELIRGPLKKDYPSIDIEEIRISLVEASGRLLSVFSEKMGNYTKKLIEKKGITVYLKNSVKEISCHGAALSDGTVIASETIIWTAGVKGEPISETDELTIKNGGRIAVESTLQLAQYGYVYIAGDLTYFEKDGIPLPQMAPVATQQGIHAARNILSAVSGKKPIPFRYRDKGSMATIGRNAAITRIGKIEMKGFIAWIIWIFIHIMYLIGFRNKIFVMINWVWDYFFFERSVRLILPRCCDSPDHNACIKRNPCR